MSDQLLYRHDESRFEVIKQGRPRSFDDDGAMFRAVSASHRTRLAYLFDPVLVSWRRFFQMKEGADAQLGFRVEPISDKETTGFRSAWRVGDTTQIATFNVSSRKER